MTHGIASTAADANDLDDAGAETAVGHDSAGLLLVHGPDGAGGAILAAEASERAALRPPSPGNGRSEGFGAIVTIAAPEGNKQSRRGRESGGGGIGVGGSADGRNGMGRRDERIGGSDGRRGQAGQGQDGHGSSREHHLWPLLLVDGYGSDPTAAAVPGTPRGYGVMLVACGSEEAKSEESENERASAIKCHVTAGAVRSKVRRYFFLLDDVLQLGKSLHT